MPTETPDVGFLLVRSFDFGGYYETRLLLALVALGVALWRLHEGDRRFLIVFAAGVVFQGLLEWQLALMGMRGAGFSIGLFGVTLSGLPAHLLQGFLEGGPLALAGWWFADMVMRRASKSAWLGYAGFLALVVMLALVVVWRSQGAPASSVRPIFAQNVLTLIVVVSSIALAALRGRGGLRALALWCAGVMIYLIWNFTPLQIGGVRQIAEAGPGGWVIADWWSQVWVMGLSFVWEVMAGKMHYIAVPIALGLIASPQSRPVIVFLHGWLMGPDIWTRVRALLEPRYRCIALWQPAHGPEPAPPAQWTMRDWVDWLFTRIGGARKVVLVGHSMGGMLALAAAAARPDRVVGVVSVGSTPRAWSEDEQRAWLAMVAGASAAWSPGLAAQLAPFLMSADFLAREPAWPEEWFVRVDQYDRANMSGLAAAVATRPDLTEAVRGFDAPLLVVHGGADAAVSVEEGRNLAAAAKGEIEILDGVGHCPPVESPDAFAQALAAFITKRWP